MEKKIIAWDGIKGCKNFKGSPVTINEAINEVGANYTVKKQSLLRVPDEVISAIAMGQVGNIDLSQYLTMDNIIPTHKATMIEESNKYINVVGDGYGVIQNSKAFEFIDLMTSGTIGGAQAPVIETAGILNDGARMYVTAKMPDKFFIDGDDREGIDDFILFTNTHDGSGAVMALFTPIRVVCNNTLNAAIRGAVNKVAFKHTKNVGEKLEFTKEENIHFIMSILNRHKIFKEEFVNQLTHLKSQKITDADALTFATYVMSGNKGMENIKLLNSNNRDIWGIDEISTRTKNQIVALRDSIESGKGQSQFRGTKLWLYNGLTTYMGNARNYKSVEDKMDSIYFGGDANKKVQLGYDYLMAA
jgi:phage/plasmid-like protein (TIGR03299 family)